MLAPCHELRSDAPWRWLRLGWSDLRSAPRQSLSYGALMVGVSYLISLATWRWGNLGLYLGLVSGFVFVGPWLALTLYSISRRLQLGQRPSLRRSFADAARSIRGALLFAVILVVVFLVWARAANTLYVFFPQTSEPALVDLLPFLAVGSAVGALFSAVVFAVSAFALPMLLDRQADAITAVVTSVNAVLRNKRTMLIWAAIVVAAVLAGLMTAWLAFAVVLPVIGHATWHGYRETIDASAWPANQSEH